MALAGLIEDCAWDSQLSSCAFSWAPEKREVKDQSTINGNFLLYYFNSEYFKIATKLYISIQPSLSKEIRTFRKLDLC